MGKFSRVGSSTRFLIIFTTRCIKGLSLNKSKVHIKKKGNFQRSHGNNLKKKEVCIICLKGKVSNLGVGA